MKLKNIFEKVQDCSAHSLLRTNTNTIFNEHIPRKVSEFIILIKILKFEPMPDKKKN